MTLHRAFPGLRDSTNVCVGDRVTLAALSLLRRLIDARVLTVDRGAGLVERAFPLLPTDTADLLKNGSPPLFAIATGTRHGRPGVAATALSQVPGFSMATTTGVPLAVSALLHTGARRPGVHTTETLIDPEAFFSALAPHCIGHPSARAMTATTTSWAPTATNAQALDASLLTALLRQATQ